MNDVKQPRKGRWWLWGGGALLLVLIAVASLPLWAGGVAVGFAEKAFADRAGRLEVGALDLSWTSRQAARDVKFYDPEGALVAEVSAELPSLLSLASGLGKRIGTVSITASADLVADDAGRTNLERALAPRAPEEPKEEKPGGGSGGGGLEGLDVEVQLTCPRLSWSDARTRALGEPFVISDLSASAVVRPGEPLALAVDGTLPGEGKLHVRGNVTGITDASGAPAGEVEAEIRGLPTGLVDALAGLDGLLLETLGPTFELTAQASGGLAAGDVTLDLDSAGAELDLRAVLADQALSASGAEQGLTLRIHDASAAIARYATPSLPEGSALSATGIEVSLRDFELPIPEASGAPADPLALLGGAKATFGFSLERASAALPGVPGGPLELTGLSSKAVLRPGAPLALALDGALSGGGQLSVTGEVAGILEGRSPTGKIEAVIAGLPTALVDAIAVQDGLLVETLGPTLDLRARADGGLEAGTVALELTGSGARLSFEGRLADRVLSAVGPEQGLALTVSDPSAALARHASSSLPAGSTLSVAGVGLTLRDFRLQLPAAPDPAADPASAAGGLDLGALLATTSATVGMSLERASVTFAEQPSAPFTLADLRLEAGLAPQKPLAVSVAAALPASAAGTPPGALEVTADVDGLAALLASPGGDPAAVLSARFQGKASGVDTAGLDALLGQNGLLLDALGASSTATFAGAWPLAEAPLTLELVSPRTQVSFTGAIQDGVLVASGQQGLDARLPLSPLVSERIIGPLVPLMVGMEKPAGGPPLAITVRDFRLPLDGNLAGLDASVHLELGEVIFQLLPGLSDTLAGFGRQISGQKASFEPFGLVIQQGVAHYDGLPITVKGHDLKFTGAFDLAKREFDFDAAVPLAVLGDGVARELDKVREYLDPNLVVPLEITGSWNKPKVTIGKAFLDTTVKQAAEGAIKRGLGDLIRKELGGD